MDTRRITTDDAVGEVHHLALEIDPLQVPYQPGDSLGVWFRNEPSLIHRLLERTGLTGSESVRVGNEDLSLADALAQRLELTQLHPKVVKAWAEACGDDKLRALAADREALRRFTERRQVMDLAAYSRDRAVEQELAALSAEVGTEEA